MCRHINENVFRGVNIHHIRRFLVVRADASMNCKNSVKMYDAQASKFRRRSIPTNCFHTRDKCSEYNNFCPKT